MRTTKLNPNQIITLNDYSVHNDTVLREYFRKCQLSKDVPFVPVVRKEIVRKYLNNTLLKKFEEFEERNPNAKYFMLDGSHRTTALTLAGCQIPVIVYEKSGDIAKARTLVATGQILESGTLKHTLEENCEILNKHFKRKPYFQTVEEKTRKMVQEKIVPKYMTGLFIKMSYFIIIRGPLGCGKSTIAQRLAETLQAEYFSIDRVLDEHNLTKDKEAGYISQRSFIKANELITPKVKKKLQSGIPVIFDGNFYWKSQIEDLIKRLNFPNYVFTLKAPLEVCIERDRKRGKTHGKDAVRVVYKKATEVDYGIVIDISKSSEKAIKEIISHLPKRNQQN